MAEVFSPERLRLARQRRGLFVQDLAALAGFSVRSVSSWENAGQVPTPENVAAVAKALNFPEAFFYAAGPPVLVGGVFRSAVRMTAAQRDTALAAGSMAIELDRFLLLLEHLDDIRQLAGADEDINILDRAAVAVEVGCHTGAHPPFHVMAVE